MSIQLLLFSSLKCVRRPEQVRQFLDDYYQRSSVVIRGHGMDQGLCLLSIQCLEVCLCTYIHMVLDT